MLEALVIGKSEFTGFRDLFTAIRQERFGYPQEMPVDEMVQVIHAYFDPEHEETHGVMALHLEVIS